MVFQGGSVGLVTRGAGLGVGGPVDGQKGDGGDGSRDGEEHCNDEPCGALCSFRRGLGDPHGVDEGVRDEQEELHILASEGDFRIAGAVVRGVLEGESVGVCVHLL